MTPSPAAARPAAAPENARTLGAGLILVAEDDIEFRRLLVSTLLKEGYEVLEAADGKELVYRLSHAIQIGQHVDCILTDVRMPKLTGLEALNYLRASRLGIPVIVITAFGDLSTRIEAWAQGAAAVLDKPLMMNDLLDEISRLKSTGAQG
jgi:CheY-like chemotaxis protein